MTKNERNQLDELIKQEHYDFERLKNYLMMIDEHQANIEGKLLVITWLVCINMLALVWLIWNM